MAELPIVRKVGEGMDKPNADNELPIDINYQRLIDWLVNPAQVAYDACDAFVYCICLVHVPGLRRSAGKSSQRTGTSACRPSMQRRPRP